MVYWAFYKLNIHKGICRDACYVFLFILSGLVVPLGLFFVFFSPICHRCFCIPASCVGSLNLGPGESCAVTVNASAIA